MIVLPKVIQRESPNKSRRVWPIPDPLFVVHETAGSYAGAVTWLCTPTYYNPDGSVKSGPDASSHYVLREDGLEVSQLVPLAMKAWTEANFNSRGISLEIADTTGRGYMSEFQLRVAARIVAWHCWKFDIPPRWSKDGHKSGYTRHRDLGVAGGNHPQCGPDLIDWTRFQHYIGKELVRGDFKRNWSEITGV